MKLKLTSIKPEAGNVKTLTFEPSAPISWKAGQYLHYTIPGTGTDGRDDNRWFTISSAPYEKHIRVTTRFFEKPSAFKQALQKLQPGGEIEADGPEGDFVVEDPDRNYIFIAGGIGITPFRSILLEAERQGQKLKVDLLYGNRDKDIVFKDELDALAAKNPNMSIDYLTHPRKLDDIRLMEALTAVDNPLVYVSGPEPMVEAFEELLPKLGLPKENFMGDYFPGYPVDQDVVPA